MSFKDVIICEKMNQALIFKEIFNLNQKKSFSGFDAVFYDDLNGIAVVSQSGHLLVQAPPEHYEPKIKTQGWNLPLLPVVPKQWKIQVKTDPRGGAIQNRINGLLAGIKFALVDNGTPAAISIAVDNDKEGELLGWEVLDYFGLLRHPSIHRLLYSQMSKENMLAAYQQKEPGSKWYPRYLAGLARARCDWLIGMNVTMALTSANQAMLPRRYVMNSGRVIFAMVYILHLRHQEVISYVKTDYHNIRGRFIKKTDDNQGFPFQAKLTLRDEWLQDAPGGNRLLLSEPKAKQLSQEALAMKQYTVRAYEAKGMRKQPPLGFDRTPFDSWMVKYHGLSLEVIASALQSLYSDKGLITYPRVEVNQLDTEMHAKMPQYVDAIKKTLMYSNTLDAAEKEKYNKIFSSIDLSRKSRIFADGINAGESHHAIIPTNNSGNFDALNPTERLVYLELADRLLIQFLPDYEYTSTSVTLSSGDFVFEASGTTPLRMGWKSIDKPEDPDDAEEDSSKIPLLSVGENVMIDSADVLYAVTKKPQYYRVNEFLEVLMSPKKFVKNKELMSRIKTLQIGTGNTRSVHVGELQKRGLAVEQTDGKGKKAAVRLLPTRKMLALAEIAPEYFKYPEMSAFWEDSFNKIQSGELSFDDFMSRQESLLHRFSADCGAGKFRLSTPIFDSEPCSATGCQGKTFRLMSAKSSKYYWSCNLCDAAYGDDDGKRGRPFPPKPNENSPKLPCPSCKKTIYQIERDSAAGKKYKCWSCPDCRANFFDNNGAIGAPFGSKAPSKGKNGGKTTRAAKAGS